MIITYNNLRIKNCKPYGYVVQKRVGTQWKYPSYYLHLGQAVSELFDRYIREEITGVDIDLDIEQARKVAQSLSDKLDDIYTDILEACKDV